MKTDVPVRLKQAQHDKKGSSAGCCEKKQPSGGMESGAETKQLKHLQLRADEKAPQ